MAINLVKEKLQKQIELLNELEIAQQAEQHKYIVKYEYDMNGKVYSLYNREEDKLIKMDRLERVKSWLAVRNIPIEQIFIKD